MQTVTLDQLIALNREMSALAAAGIPLGQGLVRVAEEFSGPSAALAGRLAKRIEAGADLAAALDAEQDALPESYRALVRAGLESGKLAAALEGYTDTASRMAELRRVVGLASIYPLLLVVATWIFFLFATSFVLPSYDWLELSEHYWVEPLRISAFGPGQVGRWMWGLLVPVLLGGAATVWWRRSARAAEAASPGVGGWLGWIPGFGRTRQLSCEANFADMLRLFVGQKVPLVEAMPLAAEASGSAQVASAARKLSQHLATGGQLQNSKKTFRQLPPLVRMALLTKQGPAGLADGLQRAADSYRQRANAWANGVAFYLPLALTAVVGGTVVGVYAVLLIQPYATTLREIALWY